MQTRTLSKELYSELESYIDSIENRDSALIEVLHEAQHLFGYLPVEVQLFIGEKMDIAASKIFGVVSFYSFFTTEPKGKYVINICTGTACFVRNADSIVREFEKSLGIKTGETTGNGMYTIECLRCVGACGLAPVVMVNDDVYGKVTPDEVNRIIGKYTE